MPAIVDHEARRSEIAGCAATLIAEGGIEAATVRQVAAAAGYSTKVVSHYFENKEELLLATYRYAAKRSSAATASEQDDSRTNITVFLKALLPIDQQQLENWKVWLAFWAYATASETFANEQRDRVNRTRADIESVLRQDARFHALTRAQVQGLAESLVTDVIGIAIQAVFDPVSWGEARQIKPIVARLRDAAIRKPD